MNKTRSRILALAGMGVASLVIAACGSSGSGSSSSSTASKPASSSAAATTLAAHSTSLGTILTTGDGRALYVFDKDTGAKSMCAGACTSEWPPFTAAKKPAVSGGASSADVTLVRRSDGKMQVDYKGHPLYLFAGDSSSGQTNGQGLNDFGGPWWVVSPAGAKITSTGGSSSTSGGWGA